MMELPAIQAPAKTVYKTAVRRGRTTTVGQRRRLSSLFATAMAIDRLRAS
jgi:hypothetical protein